MIVYHLTEKEFALDNIKNKRIKISELNDLNDPFEFSGQSFKNKSQRKEFNEWKAKMAKEFGLICFSRAWSNPVLWSHYGKKHTGIALGFDISTELLRDVIYTSTRLHPDSMAELRGENSQKYIEKWLLMKYTDWAYEDETRVFTSLKDRDKKSEKFFFQFNQEFRLKEIVVGALSSVSKNEIQDALNDYGEEVSIVKARLAHRSFNVIRDSRGLRA